MNVLTGLFLNLPPPLSDIGEIDTKEALEWLQGRRLRLVIEVVRVPFKLSLTTPTGRDTVRHTLLLETIDVISVVKPFRLVANRSLCSTAHNSIGRPKNVKKNVVFFLCGGNFARVLTIFAKKKSQTIIITIIFTGGKYIPITSLAKNSTRVNVWR